MKKCNYPKTNTKAARSQKPIAYKSYSLQNADCSASHYCKATAIVRQSLLQANRYRKSITI